MDNILLIVVVGFFSILFLLNIFKILSNIFTKFKDNSEAKENFSEALKEEVNNSVRPHLNSMKGMYEKREEEDMSFSSFVFSSFKDKLGNYVEKSEKMVETEICECCSEYENADCKEAYCLEGSGISCPKS